MSKWTEPRDREPPIVAGRVPPSDLDAEAAVLSAVMLDRDALDRIVDTLRAEHFYSDANRRVFDACLALTAENTPIDVVTVNSWLRDREQLQRIGGAPYLGQLVDATPATAHVPAHAQTVVDKWRVRRTIAECQRIAAEGYGDVGDAKQFIDDAEGALYELARTQERATTQCAGVVVDAAMKAREDAERRGDKITGIPTGFPDLDHKTAGLHRGDLMIIAARPGMGKSALALNIAQNVAEQDGLGAVLFSLEMPNEQSGHRLACSVARVDLNRFRKGELEFDDWSALRTAQDQIRDLPLWLDDASAPSLLDLRSRCRRLIAELSADGRKLGAVIVDYLQLMHGRRGASSREQQISEISRGLKQLAKDLDVPVIALSQLNRAVETRGGDKRPMLADLRESGAIEQDADAIIFIYRDEYYNDESDRRGIAELIIAKQRNGPTGMVLARWFGGCATFQTLARNEYPQADGWRTDQ